MPGARVWDNHPLVRMAMGEEDLVKNVLGDTSGTYKALSLKYKNLLRIYESMEFYYQEAIDNVTLGKPPPYWSDAGAWSLRDFQLPAFETW